MEEKLISIVVPAYNEARNVEVLYDALAAEFARLAYRWEVIFVDDGSTDDTLLRVKELASIHENVFFVEFSRNFGHQSALRAGMRMAAGQAVITMDADMQHPPRFVPSLIEAWADGYQVVYTLRAPDKRLGWFKRTSSDAFYGIFGSISQVKVDRGAADFRLLDRQVVDVINSLGEADPFLRGLVKWVGFKQKALDYVPDVRFSGESKYQFRQMLNLALRGITSFSERPLHLALWVGSLLAVASLLYLPYVIWALCTGHAMAGWASLILTVVFLGGVQLLILGLVGLYIGKIFVQSKARPEYIVRSTNIKQRIVV
ncbi:MAG: glycosyltransferase family 2 protein [Mucinivorans sp.]